MGVRLRDLLMGRLDELRYEPIEKRIRAQMGDATVIDSSRAMLVWEPKRVVPTYGVPVEDIAGEIVATPATERVDAAAAVAPMGAPQLAGRTVLDPSVPFAVRTTPGEPLTIRTPGGDREAAAFRPDDPALQGHVIVDFDGFDAWFEEDERNFAHPRDPFHRIDVVHSSRHVRVESAGELLAESSAACMLFEPPLPVRYYLPPEDVRTDLLQPSATTTLCAYKGKASYLSLPDGEDVAWSYPQPLREAVEVTGRIAFFSERVEIAVDGTPLPRVLTPWSRR